MSGNRDYGVGRQKGKPPRMGAGKDSDCRNFCRRNRADSFGTCEAVLIAVPHHQHPTLAIEAFRAGRM